MENYPNFPERKEADTGKELTPAQVRFLIGWAKRYGLDAWAGHVYLSHGTPEITEKGALANAARSPNFRGFVCSPIHQAEAETMGFDWPGTGWQCDVLFKDSQEPVVDYGWVARSEIAELEARLGPKAYRLPLVSRPSLQAKTRAIRRALLRAFPLKRKETDDRIFLN